MSRIIFPTDFSENADKAFEFALNIAKHYDDELVVVNAYDLPYSQNVMSTSLIDIMRETSRKGVVKYQERADKEEVKCQTLSLMGNPIRIVKELSIKFDDCMVVMGTKGASGLEEVLIGSNAASILHAVDVPVFTIPKSAVFGEIRRIVYCSDFQSTKNERALKRLANFAKVFKAEVLILHVLSPKSGDHDKYRAQFAKCFEGIKHSVTIEESDNVENTINDFVTTQQADMVSLLVRRYGLLEGLFHSRSFTNKVAYHTNVPFLAVHETRF
ncbi:MAG: universal stress protein [Schleiferiaceae bacterium]|jgi:nucleotide-binding universal stress UspA family protein|nr:universal stress protein [Schleiferiaceae bacterium]